MSAQARSILAFIEGFRRPRAAGAHGTQQAAYATCEAIAQQGGYRELHLYRDSQQPAQGDLVLPVNVPTRTFEKLRLKTTPEKYQAVYVANGQQIICAPHLLRPRADWAPIICSIGTTHSNGQWSNLLIALASGAIRDTDGFIFKSAAAQKLLRAVCEEWTERFRLPSSFPAVTTVIPNGVDVTANKRSDTLRDEMRRRLRLDAEDVVFLSFSRLSPGTKGDFQALVVRWKEVRERFPRAVLVLSGSNVDKAFVTDLRQLVRAAGVGDGVLIVDDPFELAADARNRLMSAADVFVHMSTGVEEASSLVVPEAMAHSLPVLTTAWAGLPELVTEGEEGFLVPTLAAPLPAYVTETLFGQAERTHALFAGKVVALDWSAFRRGALTMADPQRLAAMGAAARRRAESHDLTTLARRYIEFFASTTPQPTLFRSVSMPTFNSITGQGTPTPTDSTMGEEVIQLVEDTPPQLEAPDPNDPWLGDGLDIPNTVSGGGAVGGQVDASLYTTPPDPSKPPPTPPPYEPAPGTNFVERGVIKALDFIHGQHGNVRDFAKWIDDRNPVAPGYFQGVIGVGETLGKDAIPIVGPDPNVETRPKPWAY